MPSLFLLLYILLGECWENDCFSLTFSKYGNIISGKLRDEQSRGEIRKEEKSMTLKEFQPAEITFAEFDVEDVITTSGNPGIIDRPPDDGNEDML